MKALAPGTVIFHRHRGYGVITHVNLLTGWICARFGSEARTLDLNLSTDEVQHADGEAILFRRTPPDRMPHARLMAMVRALHQAGYEKLYLYAWPKPSGLHWRWHLFTGQRDWMARPWREGWYGSGDEDHTAWFDSVCKELLPNYMYSLDMEKAASGGLREMPPVPVIAVRAGLPAYAGPTIGWPPGWAGLWTRAHVLPAPTIAITGQPKLRATSDE